MTRLTNIVMIAFLLTGCSYSVQKNELPAVPSPSNFLTSELTYASVYAKVLRTSCNGCHGTSGGINLESYENVRANLTKVFQSTIVERKMPKSPNPPLTSEQLGLLNAWIQAGAPVTAPGVDEPPLPVLEPTFASIKTNILEPKCLSCHSPGKAVERIPLVTVQDLLDSPLEIVIPGNADESGIILAVTGQLTEKLMPPEKDSSGNPTGFARLSADEIGVLRDWINRGARE